MDVDAYLRRIGYTGPSSPSPDTLRDLQRAHLFTVPFENLDIGWKRTIVLDRKAFIRKIVQDRRGGFCYELNGAFAALLEALGFRVTLLSGRVPTAQGTPGPEYDHLALRVDLDEPWLADVGFGDSFLDPLRLKVGIEQKQNGRSFRIIELGDDHRLERTESQDSWKTEYLFNLTPHHLEEFAGMCHFHQTSPESPFTRKRVCSRATPEGRITLSEMKLIVTRDAKREERVLSSDDDWWVTLREDFGVAF
jgi:N-hydroxyarylamine O-acetyltransferase